MSIEIPINIVGNNVFDDLIPPDVERSYNVIYVTELAQCLHASYLSRKIKPARSDLAEHRRKLGILMHAGVSHFAHRRSDYKSDVPVMYSTDKYTISGKADLIRYDNGRWILYEFKFTNLSQPTYYFIREISYYAALLRLKGYNIKKGYLVLVGDKEMYQKPVSFIKNALSEMLQRAELFYEHIQKDTPPPFEPKYCRFCFMRKYCKFTLSKLKT